MRRKVKIMMMSTVRLRIFQDFAVVVEDESEWMVEFERRVLVIFLVFRIICKKFFRSTSIYKINQSS